MAGIWEARRIGLYGALNVSIDDDDVTAYANGRDTIDLTVSAHGAFLANRVPVVGPLPGRGVELRANPADGVFIDKVVEGQAQPGSIATTDAHGIVRFRVSSTKLQSVALSAVWLDEPGADHTGIVTVEFVKRKVVVQLMGINTGLDCPSPEACRPAGDDGFEPTRDALMAGEFGFAPDEFLWFSYRGGAISDSGAWLANEYSCRDTAQPYGTSIRHLTSLLHDYGSANPNTEFHLIGHSQGGLVGFQALAHLLELPEDTTIGSVISLDGPLGGAPFGHVATLTGASLLSLDACWGFFTGAAAVQVVLQFGTTTDRARQGASARHMAGFVGAAPSSLPATVRTNEQLVAWSSLLQDAPEVYTFGNRDDAVFRPPACGPLLGLLRDNTSSQRVGNAGGREISGGNLPVPSGSFATLVRETPTCLVRSHIHLLSVLPAEIGHAIGAQYGLVIVEPS